MEDKMLEEFEKKNGSRANKTGNKKKGSKKHHDDDSYTNNQLKKEFKRKKQYLKEQENWGEYDEWSDEYED